MKIAVVGTGYVGLVTGTCFAEMGNTVTCVDIDEKKVQNLQKGILPIYEPGLENLVISNYENETLKFTTKIEEALKTSTIAFIAVGTPMGDDGSADLQYVLAVASEIGQHMQHHMTIVDKSTVPVGTADKVRVAVQKELDKRGVDLTFDVVSNPEFLKEGAAIDDFMKPDRVVVGADNEVAMDVMKDLYKPFTFNHDRFIGMDVKSAEMTKYAANSMLATKISFINEISNICEKIGADVNKVRLGIGSDSRIGYKFIYPGCGYGGSCFPKDVNALVRTAAEFGYEAKLIKSVEEVNQAQKYVLIDKIKKHFLVDGRTDLSGLTFGVWGLSFKPGTDDMRDAPATTLIKEITKMGAKVKAYDPKAIEEARGHYLKGNDSVEYIEHSKYDALDGADAMVLVTEWKEFRSPDFDEVMTRLKQPVIFDGRNQYDAERKEAMGFTYYQIGVSK